MKKFKVEHPDVHALPRWAKLNMGGFIIDYETVADVATYVIELC
jgi:hypothetical protein